MVAVPQHLPIVVGAAVHGACSIRSASCLPLCLHYVIPVNRDLQSHKSLLPH